MIEFETVKHHIQKSILDVLLYQKTARFTDLRPAGVDTNLFTYHLNCLLRDGFIQKLDSGYTLSAQGLSYVDRLSTAHKRLRAQPKIISMLVVQNDAGDVLLQRRTKQPYIDTWTLPYGKLHTDDLTILAAAQREAHEKLGLPSQSMRHAGDCYIRVMSAGDVVSSTLAHVFCFTTNSITPTETLVWARPHKLAAYPLAPAVQEIMTRSFFNDPSFFEEFTSDWAA